MTSFSNEMYKLNKVEKFDYYIIKIKGYKIGKCINGRIS